MQVGLVPAVRQEQILAPQLRECLRVLQMDLPTLADEIRHIAETNPVVELSAPPDMPVVSDELHQQQCADEASFGTQADDQDYPFSVDEDAVERRQRFFDRQVASESLQEHLLSQVGAAVFTKEERQLAELIVGDINDDGRYEGSLDELSSVMDIPVGVCEQILKRVQAFDPPGVGGRNLRECLEIQVCQSEASYLVRQLMLRIIDGHLGLVARQEFDALAEQLGISRDACKEAVQALRALEPKPGRPYIANGKHPQFIRPEIEVEQQGRNLQLSACDRELPTLTINPYYVEMAADDHTSQETRRYLNERIGKAELLQQAIRRRGETVYRVAEAVFREQYEFFAKGFEALHPLTIEEIARRTGYHGTTVGRAVRGKYVRTPRGVFELSRFFCVGRLADGESTMSAVAVKCRLTALIKAEDGNALSDEDLAAELGKSGLHISRRTIAKYRAELGIPSAVERGKRRLFA